MTAPPAHFLVMAALKDATKPVTLRELEPVCGLPRTTIKKYTRRFNENGRVYIADWVKTNGRVWTPMWAWGGEPNVPKPPNVQSDRVRTARGTHTNVPRAGALAPSAKPKPGAAPEQMVRTAHLAVPVTQCKTAFVGGCEPLALGADERYTFNSY